MATQKPEWIPDQRVSMCSICGIYFGLFVRRVSKYFSSKFVILSQSSIIVELVDIYFVVNVVIKQQTYPI